MDNLVAIAIIEIAHKISGHDGSVESLLRLAMTEMKDHWLVASDSERFATAVAAIIHHCNINGLTAYADRIMWEINILNTISSGDAEKIVALEIDKYKPIGLLGLWRSL